MLWLQQEPGWLILPLLLAVVAVCFYAVRKVEFAYAIPLRWTLWLSATSAIALLLNYSGISTKPVWAVVLFCMLIWVLVETLYNWVAIDAISRSGLPIFPSYKRCETTQWPTDKSFIKLREQIRNLGFSPIGTAVGLMDGEDYLRCNLFENEETKTQLSLLFVPRGEKYLSVFYSLATLTEEGQRLITDNAFIPFGGFYPDNIHVERRPRVRSLKRLLGIHNRRIQKMGFHPVNWDMDPIEDMNRQQDKIERLNIEMGFFIEPSEREDLGTISREGRYRLWFELWTLNYLGKARRYS